MPMVLLLNQGGGGGSVSSVSIDLSALPTAGSVPRVTLGTTATPVVTVRDTGGHVIVSPPPITFSITNSNVVSVNSSTGLLTPVEVGDPSLLPLLTATCSGVSSPATPVNCIHESTASEGRPNATTLVSGNQSDFWYTDIDLVTGMATWYPGKSVAAGDYCSAQTTQTNCTGPTAVHADGVIVESATLTFSPVGHALYPHWTDRHRGRRVIRGVCGRDTLAEHRATHAATSAARPVRDHRVGCQNRRHGPFVRVQRRHVLPGSEQRHDRDQCRRQERLRRTTGFHVERPSQRSLVTAHASGADCAVPAASAVRADSQPRQPVALTWSRPPTGIEGDQEPIPECPQAWAAFTFYRYLETVIGPSGQNYTNVGLPGHRAPQRQPAPVAEAAPSSRRTVC